MYRKLKNLIAHPSCLGMYFLDEFHSILGWLLLFFSITTVLLAVVDLGKKKLDNNIAVNISNSLLYSGYIDDAKYSDYSLTGTYKQIETEYALIPDKMNASNAIRILIFPSLISLIEKSDTFKSL